MARSSRHPPTRDELLRFVADAAPWLRLLASRWGNSRWGIPGFIRIRLRSFADRADSLLLRAGRE